MLEAITVKVSNSYQITLPTLARKELNIKAGDRLLKDLLGLHKEIWQKINTTTYLEQERDAWQA